MALVAVDVLGLSYSRGGARTEGAGGDAHDAPVQSPPAGEPAVRVGAPGRRGGVFRRTPPPAPELGLCGEFRGKDDVLGESSSVESGNEGAPPRIRAPDAGSDPLQRRACAAGASRPYRRDGGPAWRAAGPAAQGPRSARPDHRRGDRRPRGARARARARGSGTSSSSLEVRAASALALGPATAPAPHALSADPAYLAAAVDGVAFPSWEGGSGWYPAGARTDRVGGRTVTTVFYSDDAGRRIGYAIVAGTPAPAVSGGVVVWRGAIAYRLLGEPGTRAVAWLRQDGCACSRAGGSAARRSCGSPAHRAREDGRGRCKKAVAAESIGAGGPREPPDRPPRRPKEPPMTRTPQFLLAALAASLSIAACGSSSSSSSSTAALAPAGSTSAAGAPGGAVVKSAPNSRTRRDGARRLQRHDPLQPQRRG